MASLTFSTLPIRIVRGVSERVRAALARRAAPPVVLAARQGGLTRLSHRALMDLHERVVEAEHAERPGVLVVVGAGKGGSTLVMADARSSAREVQVFGAAEPVAVAQALADRGFSPETSRVTLCDGAPSPGGEPVAVAHVAAHDPAVLSAVLPVLLDRLGPGGVVVVEAYAVPACRAAIDAVCEGRPVRLVQKTAAQIVREA